MPQPCEDEVAQYVKAGDLSKIPYVRQLVDGHLARLSGTTVVAERQRLARAVRDRAPDAESEMSRRVLAILDDGAAQ